MHSIYLSFQGLEKDRIESFRVRHDSLVTKVEAHITVLFPIQGYDLQRLIKSVDRLGFSGGLKIELEEEITYSENVGYLKVISGSEKIVDIYRHFLTDLGLSEEYHYEPHVTVVRDESCSESSLYLKDTTFVISGLIIEIIGENGESIIQYQI